MSEYWAGIQEILDKGGFVAWPLVIGAFLLWGTLGYRVVLLFFVDRRSARVLVKEAMAGRLARPVGIVATASAAAVDQAKKNARYLDDRLDELFFDYEVELKRYSALGKSIVQAAPLAGLLGTVSGMINTFSALGEAEGITPGGGVAGGISEALFSTQMGLAVAIPGLLVGRLLDRRQRIVEDELIKVKDIVAAEMGDHTTQQEAGS